MATRAVTGPILGPRDEPLENFTIKFAVAKGADGLVQFTSSGHYPWLETEVTTDHIGDFSVDLVTGIQYKVSFAGAFVENPDNNSVWRPPGTGFALEIVVPHGDTAISLQTIRALGGVIPDQTVAEIIQDAIAEYMANNGIADVIEKVDGIEAGATANATDAELRNRATHTGEQAIDTITGLQDALDAIPDNLADVATSGLYSDLDDVPDTFPPSPHTHDDLYTRTTDLGTAATADASDFATSAQGSLADTAVQPSADLTAAIEQRHEHANKAVLDTVSPELLVPGGGARGQVLTVGDGGTTWGWRPGGLMSPSSGTYYMSPVNQGLGRSAQNNFPISANRLIAVPMPVYRPATLTRFWCAVATAAADGGLARVAICRSLTPGGNPTTVIAEDILGIDTTGVKEVVGMSASVGVEEIWLVFLPSEDVTVQGANAVVGSRFHSGWATVIPGLYRDGVEFEPITDESLAGGWISLITTYPAFAVRT